MTADSWPFWFLLTVVFGLLSFTLGWLLAHRRDIDRMATGLAYAWDKGYNQANLERDETWHGLRPTPNPYVKAPKP